MVEALIFDMDGLLFDSERIVQRSWEDSGTALGLDQMGSHIYNTLGMNRKSRNLYFAEAVGADFPYEAFAQRTSVRFREIVEHEGLPVKPGARELLQYAREKGLKLGLATSSSGRYAAENLIQAGFYDFFDGYIYGDMVNHSKPDPEIYLKACAAVGANPGSSIALEDSPAGIRSSYAAGMLPVMIPDLVQPTEEITALLYQKFASLTEVISLLARVNGYVH